MATVLGSLLVSLGLESAQFKRELKNAKQEVDGFSKFGGKAMLAFASAAVGAAGALALLVRNSINVADEISKAASKVGIGTEELSRLRYAADLSGVSFEQLQTGVNKLNRLMVAAADGSEKAAGTFAKLGINVKNSDGSLRSSTEVLGDLAERFAGMEDGARKSALAIEIFGKAGAGMIPLLNGGRDALEQLTAEADKFGIVIDAETGRKAEEFNDNLSRLKGVSDALATQIAAEMLPVLVDLTNTLVQNAGAIRNFGAEVGNALTFVLNIGRGIGILAERFAALSPFIVNAGNRMAVLADRAALLINPLKGVLDLLARVGGAKANQDAVGLGAAGSMKSLNDIIGDSGVVFKSAGVAASDFSGGGGLGKVAGAARTATAALRGTSDAAKQLKDDVQALVDRAFPQIAALRKLNEDRSRLEEGLRAGLITPEQEAQTRFSLGTQAQGLGKADVTAFLAGGNQVLGVVEQIEDAAKRMGDELAASLSGGADDFAELKRIGADAWAELGSQLSGVLQGAQSLGDALRNLVSQLADIAIQLAFRALGTSIGIPGFAGGTNFAPGGLAIVGERGPELVNLPRGSQVIPNNELSRMGGGGKQITFNLYGVNGERQGREAASQIAMRMRHSLNGA